MWNILLSCVEISKREDWHRKVLPPSETKKMLRKNGKFSIVNKSRY